MNAKIDIDAAVSGSEIVNRAVLVSLHCAHWSGRKTDDSVTKEVAERHGLRKDAGHYVKELVRRDEFIKPILKAQTAVREVHYHLTAPWCDTGSRILPVDLMTQYAERTAPLIQRATDLARGFIENDYDRARDLARLDLNGLFNPLEYPTRDKLRKRFACEYVYLPLPDLDAADVRKHMTSADLARARATINGAVESAVRDCYQRLYACVQRIAVQLAAYSSGEVKRFTDTITGNLADLIDVLPALNLTGDPALAELIERSRTLLRAQPEELRQNDATRAAVQMDAADLMARMRRMMPQSETDE